MRQKFSSVVYGVVLCVVICVFFAGPGHALSAVDVFRRFSPAVATLMITKQDGKTAQGTGFLISSRGELLTNFHVVDDAESIGVDFSEQLRYSAKRVIAQDPGKDLALVWIERISSSLPYLTLNQNRAPEGSDLIVIGTPRGFEKTVTTGILSGYRNSETSSLIQFTAPISPGSSGSPVFDTGGKVIGIVIGAMKDAQGMNFAVDAKEISRFIQTRPFINAAGRSAAPRSRQSAEAPSPPPRASFTDIAATVELARPRSAVEPIRQKFGEPATQRERGSDYDLLLWNFPSQNSVLFVWDRAGEVERAEWMEYYDTKEAAASRAGALMAQASQSLGKPSGASKNGARWKRDDYFLGIEQHSTSKTHMVTVKATVM